ncbi:sensor histidine kinase [Cellulosilyticum ruminicola]|uniref:sensor histidine kinase n=1 Tax=Cellulosilyticum ruminicola TaxID=425254 RepID=UPI0006D06A80|nr:HAMP domain-containing sensor histidine kinase [Cellulosilyticum ruminicola]
MSSTVYGDEPLIENESLRMTRLVNDLLLLTNADSCHWHISKDETELDTLLIDLYENYLPITRQNHKALKICLPNEIFPPLLVDKDRINQCLIILLDNAITHTPPNTQITLALQQNNHFIELVIQDNGNVIPNDLKSRVFERFYQVDSSRHHKEHYGLGLSIAFEIVKLHKGNLILKDTPDGECTFIIRLSYKS